MAGKYIVEMFKYVDELHMNTPCDIKAKLIEKFGEEKVEVFRSLTLLEALTSVTLGEMVDALGS